MTTEEKALALVNEVAIEECEEVNLAPHKTLCAALRLSVIEHEDTKNELSDFRQEVSDAVEKQAQTVWDIHCRCGTRHPISFNTLEQFIIKPKPDPLVDIMEGLDGEWTPEEYAKEIRAALDAVGLEIREKSK